MKKSAYIKGLMEGLKLDINTNEGKLLSKITDLLEDICEEINNVKEDINDVWEVVDEIDEDLKDLEDVTFSDEDHDGCYKSGCNDYFCVKCPKCNQEHYMKYSDLNESELEDGEIKCPNCKSKIDLDECLVADDCDCNNADCNCSDENCNCDK